ncbi:MAG: glycoside hydrolase family 13 protein [Clostridia bacterium]|nr:glycoside hydrolase family 13 protein [Clostridia bacterium]
MQYYPFDSRNSLYREKIGALAEGETLRLKVLLHNDARVHSVYLMLKNDCQSDFSQIEMTPTTSLEEYRYYECETKLDEGLYWYYFRYTSEYGEFFVSKTETSLGVVSKEISCWQQTVYFNDYKTPDWLDGGIIYQIFPDRFYASGSQKKNVPDDRYICNKWDKQPEYRQAEGEICTLGNDYYGGDLKGITQKLDYLKSLGVNCIYLNPIFEAHSNHRYNTADYFKIDSMLGSEKDLEQLTKKAKAKGIYVILDGVFSHTGDDSVYFNRYNRYAGLGAYNSKESPYFNWYKFENYPDKYESWWGIDTLPETVEDNPLFCEFITGQNGVLKYWLNKGIKGWRLDVADELTDGILDKIRDAVKSSGQDNYLLGEVWEDASNKISYDVRRRFLRGRQLDSVMNYPFAAAIVDFAKGMDSRRLVNTVLDITENYPPQSVKLLMNHIGTHDTARILTVLGTSRIDGANREKQAEIILSPDEYELGIKRLKIAAVIQFTLPGIPAVYYGDEAGVQGGSDPFCRATYPWGKEDKALLSFYRDLGKIRRNSKAFMSGEFIPVYAQNGALAYMRKNNEGKAFIFVNREDFAVEIDLPKEFTKFENIIGVMPLNNKIKLNPFEFTVITK